MKIEWIIFVIVLILVIVYQRYKLNKQTAVIQAVDGMKDIIYWCDIIPELHYRFLSDSVDYQLGTGVKKMHMKNPELVFEIIHPEDRHLLEGKLSGLIDFRHPIVVRLQHQNGEYYWFEEVSTPIHKNGNFVGIVGVYRRIDDRMKKYKEIEYELSYDTLTGVYNRSYFEKMMAYYERNDIAVGIAIVDLDNLKLVNDRLGHRSGDEFIKTTAKILKNNVCEFISVCRIGGDEFAIFFEEATPEKINAYFDAVLKELSLHQQPIFLTNIEFSMGYAITDSSFNNMQCLFEKADQNMYEQKQSKEIQVEFHI